MSDRKASEVPHRLFDLVLALTRDEAGALWHSPNPSEYRRVNRELNQLLKKIQKDYGEDALDEALDGVAATQEMEVPNATVRGKLPKPKRPRWASSRKATRSLTAADRSALIRLASSMEKGSAERRAILSGLKGASTKVAAKDYMAWSYDFLDWWGKDRIDIHGGADTRFADELQLSITGFAGYPKEGKAHARKVFKEWEGKFLKWMDQWYRYEAANPHLLPDKEDR